MKHHRILTIALAVLALVLAASPAFAAKAPHRYSPKHGAKCRKTYKRVKHGRKIYCVKQKAKAKPKKKATPAPAQPSAPAPTEKTKLHAHLDPTFTRNPLNPFEVTYEFSASASQQAFSADSVALGSEDPAPLPSGVLALYSDGKLECAVNVGSGVEGSECPVNYSALGQHTVTTIYTSGEESATETETESIGPLATETTLSVSYEAVTPAEIDSPSAIFHVGNLTITTGSSPSAVTARLGCGEGTIEHLTPSGCYQVESTVEHVYANGNGGCLGGIWISKETERSRIQGERFDAGQLEAGAYHLRAGVVAGGGYAASEATAPLRFTPELEGDIAC